MHHRKGGHVKDTQSKEYNQANSLEIVQSHFGK